MDASKSIGPADAVLDPLASTRALVPRLLLQISEYRWLLMGLDLIAINSALLTSLSLQSGVGLNSRILADHPLWFVVISVLWLLLADAFDAYELRVADRLLTSIQAVTGAAAAATVIYLFIPYVTPPPPTTRLGVLSFPVLGIIALLAIRALSAFVLPRPVFQRRVLIIGTGQTGRTVARVLCTNGSSYEVVGFISEFPENQEVAVMLDGHESADGAQRTQIGLPILGHPRGIAAAAARYGITTLVVATPQDGDSDLLQSLTDCAERGIEATSASAVYERLTGRVPLERVGKSWYVDLPIEHAGNSSLWNLTKRTMDVVLAGLGIVGLGLIFPFLALAIYLDSPGPIFYTQERAGKGGRIFRIFKFRSMALDAERSEALWAQKNDARVTRVGWILRATHLDEFPQFLNVLRGDMSAVGPRPERPEIIGELTAQIPLYRLRHAIKPGMAGWALVKHGYARTNHEALIRLQYDLYYMKHQSLWLDIVIILKTIGRALAFKGR